LKKLWYVWNVSSRNIDEFSNIKEVTAILVRGRE